MDFADFYRTTSSRTLRYAYGLTGDLPLAQDVTQEAYARAWQRWRTVSKHHDIEAWLRVVVTRLVFDWWRRLRVRRTRMEQPQAVPAPSEETVLLSAALKQLPKAQARALALHYLLDLPITQIAEETGVAEGTVKSWLSRGRAGLAVMLRDEVETAKLAPTGDVQQRGARRRRTQMIVAGVVVLAVLAGVGIWRARGGTMPQPATRPSPSASPVAAFKSMQATGLIPDRMPDGYTAGIAIAGDRGYVAWSPPGGPATTVTALDLTTGTKLWSTPDVASDAGLFYANQDVVLVQGISRVDGSSRVTALATDDGRVLWSQRGDHSTTLLPFRDLLVVADRAAGEVAGLNWRTGQPVWQRPEQAVSAVLAMHDTPKATAIRLRATEAGPLLVVTSDGRLTEVGLADGRDRRSWSGVPVASRSDYSAYGGKLYIAGGAELSTIDLGGPGPSAFYRAPQGHTLSSPMPCLGEAVCVLDRSPEPTFLILQGGMAINRFPASTDPAVLASDGLVLLQGYPEGTGRPYFIFGDARSYYFQGLDGDPLWIHGHTILESRDTTITVRDTDPRSRDLGRLPSVPRATATDGVSLIALVDQGIAVYHLTQ
jgi:RNA polymerase sigma factor (sigma-70 family)